MQLISCCYHVYYTLCSPLLRGEAFETDNQLYQAQDTLSTMFVRQAWNGGDRQYTGCVIWTADMAHPSCC